MSNTDQRVTLELRRVGDEWHGFARDPDAPGLRILAQAAPAGSPGEVLEELALPLDAAEAERVTASKADELEAAWRRETGSRDPQGPPVGWRPSRSRVEP